jgi:hypothetical protein
VLAERDDWKRKARVANDSAHALAAALDDERAEHTATAVNLKQQNDALAAANAKPRSLPPTRKTSNV